MKKIFFFFFLLCLSLTTQTQDAQSHDNKPCVSIITSVYKGNEFIAGFLSDITRQTIFEQCELIIINANSPDDEEPIILEYAKKFRNIIYKRLDRDPGLYAVWNMAIRMARADYITNANIDDRRNPTSLQQHVQALDDNPDIDLVYSDFYVTPIPNETFECNAYQYIVLPDDFSPNMMHKCLPGPQPMWRKSMHERHGFFDESFISAGDFEMWNRAASKGSKFKKIPGISGLFFLNPKGLSSDITKKEIIEAEMQRIVKQYSDLWNTHHHYFCTAADSKYFAPLLNLIGSIHTTCFDRLGEIAVFDLGLTQEQIQHLNTIAKVSVHNVKLVHPDLLKPCKTHHNGKTVPGWYAWKFVILQQALDLFPYVLWVDAGTTILKPLDTLFNYIQQTGYFLSTIGDEKLNNQLRHPIQWCTTTYVKHYFQLDLPERKWILAQEPVLSNTIGASRKALDYLVKPLRNFVDDLRLFVDDGTTPMGFGTGRHDLTLLSIFAYLQGLTIHHQDHTQQIPIYLSVDGKNEEFYITWHGAFVNDKTCIYNSRGDLHNAQQYNQHIRYNNDQGNAVQFYSQIGQDKKIAQILNNKRNGIFVDIGAYDGIKYSNTYFFEKNLGWKGVCIEPHPDNFKKLQHNRTCHCINACINNIDGKVPFLKITNANPHDGPDLLSGICDHYDPRHLHRVNHETKADGSTQEIIEVACFTLTTVLQQNNIQHIDYLSIDTEGSELSILEGINFDLIDIDLIDIENNFGECMIQNFLESKNFILYENIGYDQIFRNKKYLDNAPS